MPISDDKYPQIKTGNVTTNASGVFNVVFDEPFDSGAYVVQLTPREFCICTWGNRTATGFRIKSRDTSGAGISAAVGWTATKNIGS